MPLNKMMLVNELSLQLQKAVKPKRIGNYKNSTAQ